MTAVSVYLIFSACLATQPDNCRKVELPAPSAIACAMNGQSEMARWLNDNPGYRLRVEQGERAYECAGGDPT